MRQVFITESLAGLHGIVDQGVPVIGYLHWSLLDNFEWGFGYRPKFGLVAVDVETFERKPRPNAVLLGDIARTNVLLR